MRNHGEGVSGTNLSESGCFLSNLSQYRFGIAWTLNKDPKKYDSTLLLKISRLFPGPDPGFQPRPCGSRCDFERAEILRGLGPRPQCKCNGQSRTTRFFFLFVVFLFRRKQNPQVPHLSDHLLRARQRGHGRGRVLRLHLCAWGNVGGKTFHHSHFQVGILLY